MSSMTNEQVLEGFAQAQTSVRVMPLATEVPTAPKTSVDFYAETVRRLRQDASEKNVRATKTWLMVQGKLPDEAKALVEKALTEIQSAAPALSFFESIATPLIKRGWKVAPLFPKLKKVHTSLVPEPLTMISKDPVQIHEWAVKEPNANVGVYAVQEPGGLLFLDVDKEGIAKLRQKYKQDTGKDFPLTLFVRSSVINGVEKGHGYFKQTAKTMASDNIKESETGGWFSLRVKNYYVASIGSIHPETGKPYEIAEDYPVIEMPTDVFEWLQAQVVEKKSAQPAEAQRDERGLVVHGEIHGFMLSAAGKMRAAGLNAEEIETALLRLVHEQCAPPIDDSLVKAMAHSICSLYRAGNAASELVLNNAPTLATSYAHLAAGTKVDGGYVGPDGKVYQAQTTPFADLLTPENLNDPNRISWVKQHIPKPYQLSDRPVGWHVDGMIMDHGVHQFSGKYGSMKTILAQLLAGAITQALPFMDRKSGGRPVMVVYIDKENPEAVVRHRCKAMGLLNLENFYIWGDWDIDNPPPESFDDPRLIECASRDNALFIFDSLSSLLDGVNESDPGEMSPVMNKLRRLARIGAGVIILHHEAKHSPGSRGTTSIPAGTDMAFIVTKKGDKITISPDRYRHGAEYTMQFEMDWGGLSGVYSYKVIDNGLAAKPEQPMVLSHRDAEKISQDRNDFEITERAKKAVFDNWKQGTPLNQRRLAELIGVTSNSARTRLLNGHPDRPWKCITSASKNVGILYYPKEAVQADGTVAEYPRPTKPTTTQDADKPKKRRGKKAAIEAGFEPAT